MGWRMLSPHYPFVYSELPEFVALECTMSPYRVVRYVPERTCRPEEVYLDNHSDLTVTVCSNCRVALDDLEEHYSCPWCGAKVVDG